MNAQDFQTWLTASDPTPLVMGILNVTPDSFSDGGRFASCEPALAHARQLIAEGADILDIGGESTRPGSARVPAEEQLARMLPVIEAIRRESDVAISVDTTLCEVARGTVEVGANMLNDVSAGREDPAILSFAAARRLPIVLMHMKGEPRTMQENPVYQDVTREVAAFLVERANAAIAAGVPASHILLDPGIGFGKTVAHNLTLLRNLPVLASLGYRVLLGASRKRFIGAITGVTEPDQRVYGSTATIAWGITNGASMVRVHDVGPTVQALKMIQAIRRA